MPVVGEAIIVVRVLSDRLAQDIKDAVKRGMERAAPDIDAEGEAAGKRMASGMGRGVRKNSDRVGKELELSASRFISGTEGIFDREGDRLGQRFADAVASGVRKNETRTRGLIDKSVSRSLALRSGSAVDKIGRDLGTRFTRAIGDGIGDGDIGKQLAIRDTGLERQGQDAGRRFGRAIGAGVGDSAEDVWRDVRKVFQFRPGDIDDDGSSTGRRFGDGVDNGFRARFARLRQSADDAAQRMAAGLGNGFRRFQTQANQAGTNIGNGFSRGFTRAASNVGNGIGNAFTRIRNNATLTGNSVNNSFTRMRTSATRSGNGIGNAFTRGFTRARTAGQGFFSTFNAGFGTLNSNANNTGNSVSNGIRRGVNRNRPGLLKMFSGLGTDLGKHFNLGIGAAKMGEAIISILATAGPSLISGAAAIGAAMASEIIVAMAAIGPGLGGAIGVGIAAVSTLALNVGLLMLAFKASGETLTAVKKEFGEVAKLIGTPIAEGMLSGLQDTVGILKNSLPALNGILTKTGEAFGNAARKIAETVTSAENMTRIQGILATNITFIDNFKDGISGLVTSFLILFNAAKPFIDFIGEGIKRFGEWAAASLAVSEANGSLATWMDGMLASFKDLWAIVKNFASGIGNVFSAAAPAGESLLGSIRGIAERFKAWTSDEGNMKRMQTFFEKAHTLASAVFGVLGAIFTAGSKAFEGMDLGPILHVLDTLETVVAPAIARIFNQIQAGASDNLVKTFDNIGTAITKIADSGAFQKVAEVMSALFLKISEFAASDFGSTILAWVLPIGLLGGAVTALLSPLLTLGRAIFALGAFAVGGEGALAGLAAAAAPFVAVAVAVAGAFALIYANSEAFRTSIGDLVTAVGSTLMEIWDKLSPKLQVAWEKLQQLAGVIGDRLAPVIEFLVPIIQRAFNFIGDTIGNFLDLMGGFIDILIGIFTGDWGKIWEGVKEVFSAAWNQVVNIFNTAKDALSFIWDAITAVIYNVGQVLYGIITSVWSGISSWLSTTWDTIKQSAIDHWNGIWAFFEGIWNQITTAFHVAVDAVKDWLSSSWDTIKQQVIDHWNGIFAFFEGIWNQITTAFHVAVDAVKDFLSNAWDTMKNAVIDAWNTVFGFFDGILTSIADAVRGFGNTIQEYWNNITAGIHTAWDGLGSIVSTIWSGIESAIVEPIKSAWQTVGEWIDKIKEIVKGVIETVTGAFDTVVTIVGDIATKQAEGVAAQGLLAANQANPLGPVNGILDRVVPALARGGIVSPVPGGQIIRVAEAGRPERVDPIQRNGLTARDESLIRMMSAQLAGVGGGSNDVNVNVSLGERSLEAFVTSVIKRNDANNARRVGRVRAT